MGLKAIQGKTRHKSPDTLMKPYVFDDEQAQKYLKVVFGT